jgi:hypothetical protein
MIAMMTGKKYPEKRSDIGDIIQEWRSAPPRTRRIQGQPKTMITQLIAPRKRLMSVFSAR